MAVYGRRWGVPGPLQPPLPSATGHPTVWNLATTFNADLHATILAFFNHRKSTKHSGTGKIEADVYSAQKKVRKFKLSSTIHFQPIDMKPTYQKSRSISFRMTTAYTFFCLIPCLNASMYKTLHSKKAFHHGNAFAFVTGNLLPAQPLE
jgi:hypothetical protein